MTEWMEIMEPETSIGFPAGEEDGEYVELRISPKDHKSISIWYKKDYAAELAKLILTLTADKDHSC